ncbi:GSCOCT00013609001.2-RA-CDS [Cotesia congregata]|uniref:Carboxylic ester hydrolase n=1 Tax=Cotesia congregata TaxID=51543 RepID=A0A8J2H5K2_COTCN|nr:GSCOCT00013609001.2-RA-CDS [Cotesia congregata]CAG5074278.1 carboxylesterase clade A member 1 [Cotesia congregata]
MEHPIVKIQEGLIRGVEEISCDGVKFLAFKGIPYAEPPVGQRRFQDSQPVKSWSGIFNASRHSRKCGQINWFSKTSSGDDDCLYLNVYTRDLTGRKPVIFTIHGGNFSFGSGDDDILGPDFLVEELIVVTINYRVGILGFLNLEDESAPGNQGLKDQVLALKWVARNISNFGGDPTNVTIYGYSAGGAAVHYLALSPLAEGLFHKAILQSGVASNPWASVSIDSMKESAVKIAGTLGFESKDLVQVLNFLKTVKIRDLLEAEASFSTWNISVNTFGPSVDSCAKNSFLKIPVEEAIKKGISVPCILGSTTHEAVMQLASKLMGLILNDEHLSLMNQDQNLVFHPSTARFLEQQNIPLDVVRKFFMNDMEISRKNIENVIQLMSFIHFLADIQHILEIQQVNDVPCYYLKFGHFSEDTAMIQKIMRTNLKGASHCEDVGYLFNMKAYEKIGIEPPQKGTVEWTIQRRFIEFWTAFAKTG